MSTEVRDDLTELEAFIAEHGMPPEAMPPADSELVESDGEPMDSPWHRAEISLLIDSLNHHWHGREDFFAGGNMFVYFSEAQVRNRDFRGPDFFVALDVVRDRPRRWWAIWSEGGHYPDFIIELTSPTTEHEDRTTKKQVYEQTFRTREYLLYDPDRSLLEGWRLGADGHYAPIPLDPRGWIWSEVLGLWIGLWEGTYLEVTTATKWPRFYTPDGVLVSIPAEAEHQRAEIERQRADTERRRAEIERRRAEAERRRADMERQAREAAETEVQRLRALLAEKSGGPAANQ